MAAFAARSETAMRAEQGVVEGRIISMISRIPFNIASVEIQKTRPGRNWRLTAQPGEVGDGTGRLRIGAK